MTLLFYDNVSTGHHRGYLDGIVGTAQMRGLDFLVGSTDPPDSLLSMDRFIPVGSAPHRAVIANRRHLRRATSVAAVKGASILIDLYLDRQVWALGAERHMDASVHVLHHAEQYSYEHRTGLGVLRTAYLRKRLAKRAKRGSMVVVHNERTAAILAPDVPDDRVLIAGYPVVPIPNERRQTRADRPTLLFIGAAREEKGLDLLFHALARQPELAHLRIVGRQPPGTRDLMTNQFPNVLAEWNDGFVDNAALHGAFAEADLAVLPYRSRFGFHGGPSSVLLETLSSGTPIVTTTALIEQLPPSYQGACVAAADSPEHLLAAVREAVRTLPQLSKAAAAEGPAFVAAHHTFDTYVDVLVKASQLIG